MLRRTGSVFLEVLLSERTKLVGDRSILENVRSLKLSGEMKLLDLEGLSEYDGAVRWVV